MRHLAIIPSLIFFLLPLAHAREQDGLGLSLEGDLRHFDYREYGDQGNLLDRESGFLPGLRLGIDHFHGAWQVTGQLSYHAGGIAYAGQTNGGAPISTTTEQQLANVELTAGHRFQSAQQIRPTLYLGAAAHSWRRDIKPTYTASGMPVRGLLETYRWWRAFLGVRISGYKAFSIDWELDARLARIIAPRIEVDYSGLYDNSQLDLGERWGVRLALPMSYSMRHSTALVIEPYLEKYKLGRSSFAQLSSQGIVKGTVFEPGSSGDNYGVMFGIRQLY